MNRMIRTGIVLAMVAGLAICATAQSAVTTTEVGRVAITSRGKDVREVLYDLFFQSKKNFVLEPTTRIELFLNLNDVTFEDALQIVTDQSSYRYEIKNGIYYISKKGGAPVIDTGTKPTDVGTTTKPSVLPQTTPIETVKGNQTDPGSGPLTDTDLRKRVTTRLHMADMRAVFAEFSHQTGITIDVDTDVPNYRVNAFLQDTSLKFALDTVVKKAHLKYTRTEGHTIRISRDAGPLS